MSCDHKGPSQTCDECFVEAVRLASKYGATLQHIMQVLGPETPSARDVDYTVPGNLSGLMADCDEVLRILRDLGFEFRRAPQRTRPH